MEKKIESDVTILLNNTFSGYVEDGEVPASRPVRTSTKPIDIDQIVDNNIKEEFAATQMPKAAVIKSAQPSYLRMTASSFSNKENAKGSGTFLRKGSRLGSTLGRTATASAAQPSLVESALTASRESFSHLEMDPQLEVTRVDEEEMLIPDPEGGKKPKSIDLVGADKRDIERKGFRRIYSRMDYLRNPRHPTSLQKDKQESKGAQYKLPGAVMSAHDGTVDEEFEFICSVDTVEFTEYGLGAVYEVPIFLRNRTGVSQRLRVEPPRLPHFSISAPSFPASRRKDVDKGPPPSNQTTSLVAPGMSVKFVVMFRPPGLADYEDSFRVLTPSSRITIPIKAWRTPPLLSLSSTIDLGKCFIGGVVEVERLVSNKGGAGNFVLARADEEPFADFALPAYVEAGDFTLSPREFGVAPGGSVTLGFAFSPSREGPVSQEIVLYCDNLTRQSIMLKGTGYNPEAMLTQVASAEQSARNKKKGGALGLEGRASVTFDRSILGEDGVDAAPPPLAHIDFGVVTTTHHTEAQIGVHNLSPLPITYKLVMERHPDHPADEDPSQVFVMATAPAVAPPYVEPKGAVGDGVSRRIQDSSAFPQPMRGIAPGGREARRGAPLLYTPASPMAGDGGVQPKSAAPGSSALGDLDRESNLYFGTHVAPGFDAEQGTMDFPTAHVPISFAPKAVGHYRAKVILYVSRQDAEHESEDADWQEQGSTIIAGVAELPRITMQPPLIALAGPLLVGKTYVERLSLRNESQIAIPFLLRQQFKGRVLRHIKDDERDWDALGPDGGFAALDTNRDGADEGAMRQTRTASRGQSRHGKRGLGLLGIDLGPSAVSPEAKQVSTADLFAKPPPLALSALPTRGELQPGEELNVEVHLLPNRSGDIEGRLTCFLPAGLGPLHTRIQTVAKGPTLEIGEPRLSFGVVPCGFVSQQQLTLVNQSDCPASFLLCESGAMELALDEAKAVMAAEDAEKEQEEEADGPDWQRGRSDDAALLTLEDLIPYRSLAQRQVSTPAGNTAMGAAHHDADLESSGLLPQDDREGAHIREGLDIAPSGAVDFPNGFRGIIPANDRLVVDVMFIAPNEAQPVRSGVDVHVRDAEKQTVIVQAQAVVPKLSISRPRVHLEETYKDVESTFTATLRSLSAVPSEFEWEEVSGRDASDPRSSKFTLSIEPARGRVEPGGSVECTFSFMPTQRGKISDLIHCRVRDAPAPLGMLLSSVVHGLAVSVIAGSATQADTFPQVEMSLPGARYGDDKQPAGKPATPKGVSFAAIGMEFTDGFSSVTAPAAIDLGDAKFGRVTSSIITIKNNCGGRTVIQPKFKKFDADIAVDDLLVDTIEDASHLSRTLADSRASRRVERNPETAKRRASQLGSVEPARPLGYGKTMQTLSRATQRSGKQSSAASRRSGSKAGSVAGASRMSGGARGMRQGGNQLATSINRKTGLPLLTNMHENATLFQSVSGFEYTQQRRVEKKFRDLAGEILREGKGLGIVAYPSLITLPPFGEAKVAIACVADMAGQYSDVLQLEIKGVDVPVDVPVSVNVSDPSLVFLPHTTGLSIKPDGKSEPVLRFQDMMANVSEQRKKFTIANSTPFDHTLQWSVHNFPVGNGSCILDFVPGDSDEEPVKVQLTVVDETEVPGTFDIEPRDAVVKAHNSKSFTVSCKSDSMGTHTARLVCHNEIYTSPAPPLKHRQQAAAALQGASNASVVKLLTEIAADKKYAHPHATVPDPLPPPTSLFAALNVIKPRLNTDGREQLKFNITSTDDPRTSTKFTRVVTLSNPTLIDLAFNLMLTGENAEDFVIRNEPPAELAHSTLRQFVTEQCPYLLRPSQTLDVYITFVPQDVPQQRKAQVDFRLENLRFDAMLEMSFINSVTQQFPLVAFFNHPEVVLNKERLAFKDTYCTPQVRMVDTPGDKPVGPKLPETRIASYTMASRTLHFTITNITDIPAEWSIYHVPQGRDYAPQPIGGFGDNTQLDPGSPTRGDPTQIRGDGAGVARSPSPAGRHSRLSGAISPHKFAFGQAAGNPDVQPIALGGTRMIHEKELTQAQSRAPQGVGQAAVDRSRPPSLVQPQLKTEPRAASGSRSRSPPNRRMSQESGASYISGSEARHAGKKEQKIRQPTHVDDPEVFSFSAIEGTIQGHGYLKPKPLEVAVTFTPNAPDRQFMSRYYVHVHRGRGVWLQAEGRGSQSETQRFDLTVR